MNNQKTVFQFSLKPQYISKPINYKKSYFKNIVRSLFVNKIRFIKKYIRYKQIKNQLSNINSMDELKSVTALSRPGCLIK